MSFFDEVDKDYFEGTKITFQKKGIRFVARWFIKAWVVKKIKELKLITDAEPKYDVAYDEIMDAETIITFLMKEFNVTEDDLK